MRFLLLLSFISFLLACQNGQSPEVKLVHSTTAVARNLYNSLTSELTVLLNKTKKLCQFPSDSYAKQSAQKQWKVAMLRWQAASVINFGPASLGSMDWKFHFWPDQRNLVKKKVDEALSGSEQWTPVEIGNTNVAARGMGAAEYLLFESDSFQNENSQSCDYLVAVVTDMKRNSFRLSRDWQKGEKRYPAELVVMADVQPDGYVDIKPISILIINSLHVSLEQVYRKLTFPVGGEDSTENRYLAESWRSRISFENLSQALSSVRILFQGGNGYGLDDRLKGLGDEGVELSVTVMQSLQEIQSDIVQFDISLFEAASYPQGKEKLLQLAQKVKQLQRVFGVDIPRVMGIPVSLR